jgi:hypothetical protein
VLQAAKEDGGTMKNAVIVSILALLAAVSTAGAGGEIYGTIELRDGRTLTGPIRWDMNENFWGDRLDATKTERLTGEEGKQGFTFSLFGWEIIDFSEGGSGTRSISIPFGHLSSLEPLPGQKALLTLKNGDEIEVRASSTDLGHANRGVIIDDADAGRQDISWWALRRVEFGEGPGKGRDKERLYGTVVTKGDSFTGYLVWDRDEAMIEDILDGDDEEGTRHKIPFGDIKEVERLDDGSRVRLTSGEVMELDGTNDVDNDHRGMIVTLDGVGSAEIDWWNVLKVTFSDPPDSPAYGRFDGGRRLRGVVHTTAGASYRGMIVWDLDEAYTWETLDGSIDGADFAVTFENIKSITPRGYESSEVRLRNDEVLVLSGSNDVDGSNDGLYIIPDPKEGQSGETVSIALEWDELRSVEFD